MLVFVLLLIEVIMDNLADKITEFLENEARSCSMDFGCVTPEYVYRMLGGKVAYDEIALALKEAKQRI